MDVQEIACHHHRSGQPAAFVQILQRIHHCDQLDVIFQLSDRIRDLLSGFLRVPQCDRLVDKQPQSLCCLQRIHDINIIASAHLSGKQRRLVRS